ncbi:unnamed protein product [Durusdinium trenchii]|uniref:Retrovirus-related Pol polyprotein from transposon TNT 1-94 n=2 Tax=Durusdinium trenchii TaxID=1381693 RepID=A0ABP0L9T8_9DINO
MPSDHYDELGSAASGASGAAMEDSETEFQTEVQEIEYSDDEVPQKPQEVFSETHAFGETFGLLQLLQSEVVVLRQSFEILNKAMGDDKGMVGDAIYSSLAGALISIKDKFSTPRSLMSMRLYNGFRLLCDKCEDPEEMKSYVETLAFRHLGYEITEMRVEAVKDAFGELLQQNATDSPPGSIAAWRQVLSYTGSAYSFVSTSYGERLKVIREDWDSVQSAAEADDEDEAVVRSFGKMCAFSNQVMGQETENWMEELLEVFHVLVERISNPSLLQEECELLAISVSKSKEIDFGKFKPVMMAALRSLLPKTWSTSHETAWEWLWQTIARNLKEATAKVRMYKPYNAHLFSVLGDEQLEHFRSTIYTHFFSKCAASQDLFKQSLTRLRYIADRVLQSSYDMFHKPKIEMVDELSALGLRHVGYGVPIELFGPFADSCVEVIKPVIDALPEGKALAASGDAFGLSPKNDSPMVPTKSGSGDAAHLMLEGFRWSIGLVSRVLVRTIIEGSTAVMQAIHQADPKRLRRALREAPRSERFTWQLSVRVGSQSISPLYWALRSGAHNVAKTMIQDVLTIRADRDNYYYGVNDLFRLQPDVVENILREAPQLAENFLDGLIWRSHKTLEGWRPVIYYLEHLLQDMDENKTISRALKSFVKFNHPKTIMHPILTFTLDMLWERLAMRIFLKDQVLTLINFVLFLLSACVLNHFDSDASKYCLAVVRLLVYIMGFGKLLYLHSEAMVKAFATGSFKKVGPFSVPQYLTNGPDFIGLLLMLDMMAMLTVEPMVRCLGADNQLLRFTCETWTEGMSFAYETFIVVGIFFYTLLVLELASVSIELSEYRVLCLNAVKQVLICVGAVFITVCAFTFAIVAADHELARLSAHEWDSFGSIMAMLIEMVVGVLDLQVLHELSVESPFILLLVILFMLMVYSFLFNLLISQFCGVYNSLAGDIKGYARLARGLIILDSLKDLKVERWKAFVESLDLQRRVDFEEGDLGLAGGVKTLEPALDHPVAKDPIIRFGGQPDPALPFPEKKIVDEEGSMERTIQTTIRKSLEKMLGKRLASDYDSADKSSSYHSSSHRSEM